MGNMRRSVKVLLKWATDVANGTYFKFAKANGNTSGFEHTLTLKLDIKPSETFDNKVYNLKLASHKISRYVVLPGQVFSFWNSIGNPDRRFKKGRSIINGTLSEESGGGLCQVSGIIYYAALRSGLEVLERYNHSVDIYNDETRFTPLGTDATVVYGHKDLRLCNNFDFPIRFYLEVDGATLLLHLQSPQEIEEKTLRFVPEETAHNISVSVYDNRETLLNRSVYKKPVTLKSHIF